MTPTLDEKQAAPKGSRVDLGRYAGTYGGYIEKEAMTKLTAEDVANWLALRAPHRDYASLVRHLEAVRVAAQAWKDSTFDPKGDEEATSLALFIALAACDKIMEGKP